MRRTFALLQAAWLAMLIAEPTSLHPCPMHASGHGSHAAHAATDSEQGATPHCQCLGQCCVAAVDALGARVAIAGARIVTVAVYAPATGARIASRAADLRLPFANAPPVVLTA